MMETTEITRVTAKARESTDGTMWVLEVEYPICGALHVHGAGIVASEPNGPSSQYYGHRMAHCNGGEYFVESASKVKP